MKIRVKIFLIFFGVSFVLTATAMFFMLIFSGSSLKESIYNQLSAVTYLKATHVDSFLNQQKQKNIVLSKNHHWVDFLNQLYDEKLPKNILVNEFYSYSEDVLKDNLYVKHYNILILDKNGDVVFSTKRQWIGDSKSNSDYFLNSKEDTFVGDIYYEEEDNIYVYAISSPIFDKANNNEYLGSFVSLIDMEILSNLLNDGVDLGETGEVYLFNREGYMITPSRFIENSVLTQKVDSLNLKNCFNMVDLLNQQKAIELHSAEHKSGVYSNYMDKNVLGVHSPLSVVDWCVLSEIDEVEALTPFYQLLVVSLIISVIILIITSLTSNWIGLIISEPVKKLRNSIGIVEKGNLDYSVDLGTKDEIGQLSRAFQSMIIAVKKTTKNIDKKVEKQTNDIVLKKESIEKQQLAILNILEDVEKEKEKADFEKEKVNTLLHSIGDGVFAVNEDMNIILFNEAAVKISGFSSEEVMGKKYYDVLKFVNEKDDSPADGFIKEVMKSNLMKEMPEGTILIKKDGVRVPVADSAAPIEDTSGKINGCIIVFRDITRKKKIEQMKSEFVSIASHQLRTPLTGIQWVTERLLKISDKLPEKERGYINDIYLSAKRLSRLVDDLLNVSRIEGGRIAISPEKVDVVSFMKNYFKEIQPLAVQKNIKLNLDIEDEVIEMITDRSALQNIYQSLISNAIEYTPKGGNIVVGVKKIDGKVLFKVSDNGIGIPKDDQDTIFEKFTRGANAVGVKTDGTGFGLYIAKQTTDLLGGDIRFETEENKGTTFFVELPVESKAVKGEKKLA